MRFGTGEAAARRKQLQDQDARIAELTDEVAALREGFDRRGESFNDLLVSLSREIELTKSLTKDVARYKVALQHCEKYFADRADAEYQTESPGPVGNEEMRLLCIARNALKEGL